MTTNMVKGKAFFLLFLSLVIVTVFLSYSNHFNNTFHFDDSHTIENNHAIEDLTIGLFFKDGSTFSSLPSNQSYRPLTTLENAIDYKISKGLNTKYFHIHIFIVYLLTCFVFGLFLFELTKNRLVSLIIASIFALHTANAETVNYIIQRAEITSALFILLGLYFYVKKGFFKKTYLYLLFPLIGFFSKEMSFVFAPLLFLYILVFEENVDLLHFYRNAEFKGLWRSIKKSLPAILLTAGFLVFYSKMLPPTFSSGGLSKFEYFITQPWVVLHYLKVYFFPLNLSADTDWVTFTSLADYRVIIGFIIILCLLWFGLKMAKNANTKLISFGLLWFFISLIPTSTIVPFAEVLNDHRTFIPYLGLTISIIFGVKFLLEKYKVDYTQNSTTKIVLLLIIIGFVGSNSFGVYQRNKVWKTEESLWKDVTSKSPKNGRGMMNYGLALMSKADYQGAEVYFNKAVKLTPNYPYIYINLGVLKSAIGDNTAAENNFKYAIQLDLTQHNGWYYYGEFLFKQERYQEAVNCFLNVNEYSPNFLNTNEYMLQSYHNLSDWDKIKQQAITILQEDPNNQLASQYLIIAQNKKSINEVLLENIKISPTAEKYLDLSLKYFQVANFERCIIAAKEAIEINPNYSEAYNNIGIAYYEMLEYDKSIKAFKKALEINPQNEMALNNLTNTVNDELIFKALVTNKEKSDFYLNLSLQQYNKRFYQRSILFAEESNKYMLNANAFNNICSAYNQLGKYSNAIQACKEALKINPNHEHAKGNLAYSETQSKK